MFSSEKNDILFTYTLLFQTTFKTLMIKTLIYFKFIMQARLAAVHYYRLVVMTPPDHLLITCIVFHNDSISFLMFDSFN